jgi:hypothetical protein
MEETVMRISFLEMNDGRCGFPYPQRKERPEQGERIRKTQVQAQVQGIGQVQGRPAGGRRRDCFQGVRGTRLLA